MKVQELQTSLWERTKELILPASSSVDLMLYANFGMPYASLSEEEDAGSDTRLEMDPWYQIDPKTHLPIF